MQPTSVRWVDVLKGKDVRSRLVGRDFKPKGEKDNAGIFAAMPPLEAKKMLFSRAASQVGQCKVKKLLFVDAVKAHINGKCDEDAYIELPEEVGVVGMCARLEYWLYGMRPAARAWEDLYASLLKRRFHPGSFCPDDLLQSHHGC